ncbi:hypothetical protein Z517_05935 [Fonsecaea pedrosoi CBS 271.37]|uniref:Myb-like domain-containing protein n=1 Tax=Fonsecaea pedrosoi CBS 271.37 TaxID=1442368 RepID=A0A0D2GEU4_9EURO|nr:uncharacterized protein Z517_05935 [Fonsecaea pedrosoi CBS 271.37]KIW79323.1 hypothetical protein Z517_05935 [Fonsecaea pedrosoi CBS 271.37]
MSNPWNDATEKLLLFSMIEEPDNCSRAKFEQAAVAIGGGVSANACRQKFYKLKKEGEKLLQQDDAAVSSDPATPVKEKTTKTPTGKPASGRKRKGTDGDGEKVNTAVKRKRNVKKEAPADAWPEVKTKIEEDESAAVKGEVEHSEDE